MDQAIDYATQKSAAYDGDAALKSLRLRFAQEDAREQNYLKDLSQAFDDAIRAGNAMEWIPARDSNGDTNWPSGIFQTRRCWGPEEANGFIVVTFSYGREISPHLIEPFQKLLLNRNEKIAEVIVKGESVCWREFLCLPNSYRYEVYMKMFA